MASHPDVSRHGIRALSTALAGSVATAACVTGILQAWFSTSRATGSAATVDDVLWAAMVWAALGLSGWLGLGSVLAVGATLPGALGAGCERLSRWLTPRLLRQGVAMALGTAVATVALPSGAATGLGLHRPAGPTEERVPETPPTAATRLGEPAPDPAFAPTATSLPVLHGVSAPLGAAGGDAPPTGPDPDWLPSPPVRVTDPDRTALLAPAPRTATVLDSAITVRRGDTLWDIAARHLGPGASEAEISLEWPRWHRANRGVIGPDPDRLFPGQQLRPPTDGVPE